MFVAEAKDKTGSLRSWRLKIILMSSRARHSIKTTWRPGADIGMLGRPTQSTRPHVVETPPETLDYHLTFIYKLCLQGNGFATGHHPGAARRPGVSTPLGCGHGSDLMSRVLDEFIATAGSRIGLEERDQIRNDALSAVSSAPSKASADRRRYGQGRLWTWQPRHDGSSIECRAGP